MNIWEKRRTIRVEPTENVKFVEGNSTCISERWSLQDLTFTILYSCGSVVGTSANVFVMAAIVQPSSRSRTILLFSLCLSDLLVCLISMPLSLFIILIRFWTIGTISCKVTYYFQVRGNYHLFQLAATLEIDLSDLNSFQSLPVAASTISLMMLALDRYTTVSRIRILYKFHARHKIISVWIAAAFITSPILYVMEAAVEQCKESWPSENFQTGTFC